ncbi:hypothetical protein AgCh_022111 [Apium graveolens]
MEAARAIINAVHGASIDQIVLFRASCVKVLWNVPTVFSDDVNMVLACLEVSAKLKVVTITCNGKLIDNVQFQKYLIMLQGRRFQLADIDGLPKSKKLWKIMVNIGGFRVDQFDGKGNFTLSQRRVMDILTQQKQARAFKGKE